MTLEPGVFSCSIRKRSVNCVAAALWAGPRKVDVEVDDGVDRGGTARLVVRTLPFTVFLSFSLARSSLSFS